jgi:hypothetical protein
MPNKQQIITDVKTIQCVSDNVSDGFKTVIVQILTQKNA